MIQRYNDFVNEAKKAGEKKEETDKLVSDLINMLEKSPKVEMSNGWPTEKYAYTLSGIKKYMATKGHSAEEVESAMHSLKNSKEYKADGTKVKTVSVEVAKFEENYPYFFIEKDLDKYAIEEYYDNQQKDTKAEMKEKKEISAKAVANKKKEEVENKEKKKVTKKAPAKPRKTVARK